MNLIKIATILLSAIILSQAQSPYPNPGSMDKYTVFGFSQHWDFTAVDTQVFHTSPDLIIRGWSQWDIWGTSPADFAHSKVSEYHKRNISFTGGVTTTVYFFDEAADSAQLKDMVTRDASGNLIPRDIVGQGAFRGNIANPAYRTYVINNAKYQIDAGADGMFFDEAISCYNGAIWNGNEGFDDYTLKDFNAYLAAKYPSFTKSDWISTFKMTDSNYINTSRPLNDLDSNFNYRKYLAEHNWKLNPLIASNPLSKEWGKVLDNRADTVSNTFLAKYTTKYWRDIVTRTRQYAKDTYGKDILITSNGLFPYVDFQSFGLYNGNKDDDGSEFNYVPVSSGHLDGSVSLQNIFKNIYMRGNALANGAPVVLFIDWPTQMMTDYYNLPLIEKEDYWKIYAAESYANGLFFSFHLRTAMYPQEDPTAADQGILDFLRDYPKFYKENASFYHHNEILSKQITISQTGINSSLMWQPDSGRYTLHLVNHNYVNGTGMTGKENFTVSLSLDSVPRSVYVKSPDFTGYHVLNSNYSNGVLNITVDNLVYYDVLVLDYLNTVSIHSPQKNPVQIRSGSFSVYPEIKGEKLLLHSNFPVSEKVIASLYTMNGAKVATIFDGNVGAGIQTTNLKIKNLPGSVYLMRINTGKQSIVRNVCFTR